MQHQAREKKVRRRREGGGGGGVGSRMASVLAIKKNSKPGIF